MDQSFLSPEQMVPFLRHEDPVVRHHVLNYFRDSFQFGSLTAEDYWEVIDRLGEVYETRGFAAELQRLPQTQASLQRLVKALHSNPSNNFERHYQEAAGSMDMGLLTAHHQELLDCPRLSAQTRKHLEFRLKLLDESPQSAWDQLMRHGREVGDAYAGDFDLDLSEALIEAAARGGEEICRQALTVLNDESATEDWREIFAVSLLGAARYEPAIDTLVGTLAIDADLLRERANEALSRIGTDQVIQKIMEFYPGKPWHMRLFARTALANIKRPQSVAALLELLNIEKAIQASEPRDPEEGGELELVMLTELTKLGSLAALEESRRYCAENLHDPEIQPLQEGLLATALMHGVDLPESAPWRLEYEKRERRMRKMLENMDSQSSFLDRLFQNQKQNPARLDPDPPPADDPLHPVQPIRNAAPKVGRNDPCPCGSGKKYKKCCGK